eukprot:Sspe_Gene.26878::Locus_11344_Transcript_1_1_Confidence_1.000_Length_5053::g.26878::m.26878
MNEVPRQDREQCTLVMPTLYEVEEVPPGIWSSIALFFIGCAQVVLGIVLLSTPLGERLLRSGIADMIKGVWSLMTQTPIDWTAKAGTTATSAVTRAVVDTAISSAAGEAAGYLTQKILNMLVPKVKESAQEAVAKCLNQGNMVVECRTLYIADRLNANSRCWSHVEEKARKYINTHQPKWVRALKHTQDVTRELLGPVKYCVDLATTTIDMYNIVTHFDNFCTQLSAWIKDEARIAMRDLDEKRKSGNGDHAKHAQAYQHDKTVALFASMAADGMLGKISCGIGDKATSYSSAAIQKVAHAALEQVRNRARGKQVQKLKELQEQSKKAEEKQKQPKAQEPKEKPKKAEEEQKQPEAVQRLKKTQRSSGEHVLEDMLRSKEDYLLLEDRFDLAVKFPDLPGSSELNDMLHQSAHHIASNIMQSKGYEALLSISSDLQAGKVDEKVNVRCVTDLLDTKVIQSISDCVAMMLLWKNGSLPEPLELFRTGMALVDMEPHVSGALLASCHSVPFAEGLPNLTTRLGYGIAAVGVATAWQKGDYVGMAISAVAVPYPIIGLALHIIWTHIPDSYKVAVNSGIEDGVKTIVTAAIG